VSTQLIGPLNAEQLEIRCNVGDAIVANLAVHIVLFFERHLDTRALTRAFANAPHESSDLRGANGGGQRQDANPM
jgi:hypothetical protein